MDDLTGKISELLSDPEAMEQIKGLAGLLGQQPMTNDTESEPEKSEPVKKNESNDSDGLGFDMLQMAMKFMPLLSNFKKEDDTTKLLKAIRPFLSKERQKKLDEAMKLLKIMKIIPLLKEGFFNTGG